MFREGMRFACTGLFRRVAFFAPLFFVEPPLRSLRERRLPFFGARMRKCFCALRNGCRPMIAWTFWATSAGMLGAFWAAV
jgi:hypothetical protein